MVSIYVEENKTEWVWHLICIFWGKLYLWQYLYHIPYLYKCHSRFKVCMYVDGRRGHRQTGKPPADLGKKLRTNRVK